MIRMWLTFLLLAPFLAAAKERVHYFTKDSLPNELKNGWAFHTGDSAQWAATDYNDSSWEFTESALYLKSVPASPADSFSSIAWLRYTLVIDSTLTLTPLVYNLTHYGASEVFIDGRKINVSGEINGGKSIYSDPQRLPVAFVFGQPGRHVIAVRYANYDAKRIFRMYGRSFAGIHLKLNHANNGIYSFVYSGFAISASTWFMFGLFLALSFIHMSMFLYYRSARSNLYFSIFCFSMALIFAIIFINRFANTPLLQHNAIYVSLIIASASCLSLSGMMNIQFQGRKRLFRIIAGASIIIPFLFFIRFDLMLIAYTCLILTTALEAVILIIRAVFRRIPGAHILGSGILFFALFFLGIFAFLITHGGDISDDNLTGRIIELTGLLAVLSVPASISIYLAWSFANTNKALKQQLQQVQTLSEKALQQEQEKQQLLENRREELETEVAARTADLQAEKKKSDDLLMNILPEEIAGELKETGRSSARFFDNVTVLFSDFVNFTTASERMTPQELVNELHSCFKAFDDIITKYNIEKIKTIGDAYLAVSGLPLAQQEHAINVAKAALEMRAYMTDRKATLGDKTFDIRIGLHSGSVVAGIVGVKKFAYDIWGDTVNTAARMEQNSLPGKINISQATYELIKNHFTCTYRGEIPAKNKGDMKMYFVER